MGRGKYVSRGSEQGGRKGQKRGEINKKRHQKKNKTPTSLRECWRKKEKQMIRRKEG